MQKTLESIKEQKKICVEKDSERVFIFDKLETLELLIEEGAKVKMWLILTEGQTELIKQNLKMIGGKSEIVLNIIVIGREKKRILLNQKIEQMARQTKAEVVLKAVLFEGSELNYFGKITVDKVAEESESRMFCQTILMSEEARVKMVPALEIVPNEVKASHAASIGKIDEEMLFYLETRGISRKEAEKMVIEGLLKEVLKELDEENHNKFWSLIEEKLG